MRLSLTLVMAGIASTAAPSQDLWDPTRMRDFRFTFASANFWTQLQQSRTTGQEVQADLDVDGLLYQNIGIRIRSSSSSAVGGFKMPFNLKLDRFVPGQNLYGFNTLNLNNGAIDPTLTRETISYHVLREYIPAPRTAYIRLWLNDQFWGVYILVEQPNKRFLRDWFGSDDGARFKGDQPGAAVVESSTLQWLGSQVSRYQARYELKTTGHPTAWNDLVHMIDKLNNTPNATFETEVEKVINVDRALWYMAVMNLLVNSDDYVGAGHNYYMYFDPADGRMNMLPWDLNESFGAHGPSTNPWLYPVLQGANAANRPLTRRLLAVPRWRELYYAHYRTVLNEWFNWPNVLTNLNLKFQDLIRADVQRDPNLLYPGRFRPGCTGRFFASFHWVYCLRQVVQSRESFLRTHRALTKPEPEITAVRSLQESVAPGSPFWVTAKVTGSPAIRDVELRYTEVGAFRSVRMLDDGASRDGAAGDNVYGASFPAGTPLRTMRYYVHATDTAGTVQVHPLRAEHETFTFRVGSGQPTGVLRVNEIVADNDTGDTDEAGEFEDWIELQNTAAQPSDAGDHYLTDDPDRPRKWKIPAGTVITAGGHLRIWCDDEPLDGPLHASFRLSKDGEFVALYNTDANGNAFLDAVAFSRQTGDRAYGRLPDGSGPFFFLWQPTGGASALPSGTTNRYDTRRTGNESGFDLQSSGTPQVGQTFTFELRDGAPNAPAALAFGANTAQFPLPPIGLLLIDPAGAVVVPAPLDGGGDLDLPVGVPAGAGNTTLFAQAVQAVPTELSNGLAIHIAP